MTWTGKIKEAEESQCGHAPKTDTPATQVPRFNLQWEADDSSYPRMEQYEHGLYVRTADHLAKIRNLESTLAAERASRTYAELEAQRIGFEQGRLQADTEQFNAGIAMAARVADEMESAASSRLAIGPNFDAHVQFDVAHEISRVIRSLSKPSVSPEQAEERGR